MHVRSSLQAIKKRTKDAKIIRRGKKVFVIDNKNRKINTRQG